LEFRPVRSHQNKDLLRNLVTSTTLLSYYSSLYTSPHTISGFRYERYSCIVWRQGSESPDSDLRGRCISFFAIWLRSYVPCSTLLTVEGVLAGLISGPAFVDVFDNPDAKLLGTIVAIYEVGCFFGACITFVIGDMLGRKRSIILGLFIMLIGTVLQTSASTVAHLIVGRIVTGLGNGINTSCVPMYQAETSSAKSRGRLVSLEGWFITIGIVIAYWITYGTSSSHNAAIQFRTPIALQAVFAIVTLICLLKLPESPRWLLLKQRGDEAQEVLAMLDGKDTPIDAPHIIEQRADIEEVIAAESTTTIRDMFRNGQQKTMLRLALAYGIQMMQQLTGINAVIFYVPILLEQTMGLDHSLALIVSGCTGICFLVFTFLPILYIDSVGRRKPLMLGAAGQSISMMLLAILLRIGGKGPSTAAIIFIFVYIATYSGFGWVAIPWLYPTEINELRFRAKGAALATTANWIWNFAIVEITPIGIKNLGWKFYLIFMVFNAVFVPIIYFFYPETAGKTLEELDLLYATSKRGSISVARRSHQGTEIPEGSLARRRSSVGSMQVEKEKPSLSGRPHGSAV